MPGLCRICLVGWCFCGFGGCCFGFGVLLCELLLWYVLSCGCLQYDFDAGALCSGLRWLGVVQVLDCVGLLVWLIALSLFYSFCYLDMFALLVWLMVAGFAFPGFVLLLDMFVAVDLL